MELRLWRPPSRSGESPLTCSDVATALGYPQDRSVYVPDHGVCPYARTRRLQVGGGSQEVARSAGGSVKGSAPASARVQALGCTLGCTSESDPRIKRRARRLSKPSQPVRSFGLSRDGVVRLIRAHPRPCVGVAAPVAARGSTDLVQLVAITAARDRSVVYKWRRVEGRAACTLLAAAVAVHVHPLSSDALAAILAARRSLRFTDQCQLSAPESP